VAVLDCNGDYKPDLFFAGGENNASLFINHSETAGDLQFQQKDNYSTVAHTNVTGAYPLDIDNDGNMDLAVMRVGRNRLLRARPGVPAMITIFTDQTRVQVALMKVTTLFTQSH